MPASPVRHRCCCRVGDDRYDSTLDCLVSAGHYGWCSCLRFDVGSSTPGNLRRRASEDRSRRPLSLPHARLGCRSVGPRWRREDRLLVALDGRGVCRSWIRRHQRGAVAQHRCPGLCTEGCPPGREAPSSRRSLGSHHRDRYVEGGVITVLTTAAIADPNVRFVVLAGCPPSWDNGIRAGFQALGRAQGRVLSMYDRYDSVVSSCSLYFRNSPGLTFKEMILDGNRGHALFYTPDRLWVDPAVAWALGREID